MSFAITQGLFSRDVVDHFAILGLPVDAEPKTVRKAYLKIAQRLHPDTCKAKDQQEKQLASDLLSKLVNPAYEQLSKGASWSEFQVILKQVSRQLNGEADDKSPIKTAIAQELHKTSGDITEAYHSQVAELAKTNYKDISTVLTTIATLSELNLVFLKLTVQSKSSLLGKGTSTSRQTMGDRPTATAAKRTSPGSGQTMSSARTTSTGKNETQGTSSSSLEAAIWRAEQYLKKKQYAKATMELRDAIKLDPNSVKAHALMGFSYLQQNQIAMAKVHIKKAYIAKPSDPLARKAKLALEKAMGTALETQTGRQKQSPSKKGGLFGGLFGGKKK